MVSLPTVRGCCCGCSLKTGAIIIGAINLTCCIIFALLCLISLIGVGAGLVNQDEIQQYTETPGEPIRFTFAGTMIFLGITLVVCLFYIGVASCLIHGAKQDKPKFLQPWIILTAISIFFDILNIVKAIILLMIFDAVSGILGLALGIYLFIVVWSLKKELEEGVTPGRC